MPCPFAPMLALLPGLPFIPWLLGLFLKKKENEPLAEEDISIPFANPHFSSFEFYSSDAPHFRKEKASLSEKIETSEFLVFGDCSDVMPARKLAEILQESNAKSATLKNEQLNLKLTEEPKPILAKILQLSSKEVETPTYQ